MNRLRANLRKLQQWVDFAEGADVAPSLIVEAGEGLVAIGSSGLKQVLAMSASDTAAIRNELRHALRRLASGDMVTVYPVRVGFLLSKHGPASSRRSRARQFASASVDGDHVRDVLVYLVTRLLTTVAVDYLHVCPAADCGKAFVKVTKKRYCSARCQSRDYMRARRAKERAEREAFFTKGSRGRR